MMWHLLSGVWSAGIGVVVHFNDAYQITHKSLLLHAITVSATVTVAAAQFYYVNTHINVRTVSQVIVHSSCLISSNMTVSLKKTEQIRFCLYHNLLCMMHEDRHAKRNSCNWPKSITFRMLKAQLFFRLNASLFDAWRQQCHSTLPIAISVSSLT